MKHSLLPLRCAALLLTVLAVLAGSLRSEARPRPRPLVPRAAAPQAVTATILYGFNFTSGGYSPQHGVIQGPDGSLYGVTTDNPGSVFQIAPDGTFHSLHQFSNSDPNDGYYPTTKLLLVGNQLFGTCALGGPGDPGYSGAGTVFVIDLSKVSPTDNSAGFSVIHYFAGSSGQPDGGKPRGALCLASDGNLYGTTSFDPTYPSGTIFQIKPDNSGHFSVTPRTTPSGMDTFNGSYTTIFDFGTGDGLKPYAGVVQGPDGFLYGTTQGGGGPASLGTVYKVGTDGKGFTLLHALASDASGNAPEGAAPQSVPLFASDGSLYGTAPYGGQAEGGTVFQIKPDSNGVFSADAPFQVIHDFSPIPAGSQPVDGLIQATDGNLYGGTYGGGAISGVNDGSIFRIAASGGQFSAASLFSTIYSFNAYDNNDTGGSRVSGPLIQGLDGRLYGETIGGGPGGAGTVFALDAGLPAPPAVTRVAGSLAPPDITTGDTTLVIHGTVFAVGDTVSVDGQNVPVASHDYSQADETITVTLPSPLTAGAHSVVVADTAPGVRVSSPFAFFVTLRLAPVTALELTVNNSVPVGGVILTPGGAGFSGKATLMQINPDPNSLPKPKAPAARSLSAPTRVAAKAAPASAYTGGSPIIDHVRIETVLDDTTNQPVATFLVVEGSNFDPALADQGKVTFDGQPIPNLYISHDPANVNSLQCTLTAVLADNNTHFLSVTNPNGKTSQTVACGVLVGTFDSDEQFVGQSPTSYQVSINESSLVGAGTSLGVTAQSPAGSAFQKVAIGESSALAGASLIGQDGCGIVAQGGGNIVAQGGGNLIGEDGSSLVVPDGASIVAKGDVKLISQDGSGLISQDGSGLISQDGSGLISQDGGGLQVAGGDVDTGIGSASAAPAGSRALVPRATPAAATTSNGYMDVTLFVSQAGQGMRLLVTRYTPGERDLILYKDPSVTVTPSAGTPPPVAAMTAGVAVTRGPVTRDSHTHQPFQVLTLTNTGKTTLAGPFLIGLTGLPAGVTVTAPTSIVAGSPAVAAPGGTLAPGASVQVRVDFTDPTNARFSYGTAVYAGL